jgi:hypothetical protein
MYDLGQQEETTISLWNIFEKTSKLIKRTARSPDRTISSANKF